MDDQMAYDDDDVEGESGASGPRYYTSTPTKIYERSQRWASHRNKAVEREQDKHRDDDLSDCTFHPSLQRAGVADVYEPASPSFYQHVQRQQGARRERQEAAGRSQLDTSKWTARPTEVQEFSFGKGTSRGIASLRKPMTSVVSWDAPRSQTPPTAARRTPGAAAADELHELRQGQVQHEHEVAKLNGTITALRRELDAAKAKIRQLALSAA